MLRRAATTACLLLTAALQPAWADPAAVPPPAARVTDLTDTLTAEQRRMIEINLAWIERCTGAQIAVLIVPITGAESIETYALRVFNDWRLGRKGIDDGILLLVAKADRRMRLEVGTGLKTAIPDAAAARILHDDMVPAFRAGDFARGITDAIAALVPLIARDGLPKPEKAPQAAPMPPALAKAA